VLEAKPSHHHSSRYRNLYRSPSLPFNYLNPYFKPLQYYILQQLLSFSFHQQQQQLHSQKTSLSGHSLPPVDLLVVINYFLELIAKQQHLRFHCDLFLRLPKAITATV
jgi:hypothetical protein